MTFCRSVGLAARSVTNKASAHDYGNNLEIDNYYMKQSGAEVKCQQGDSGLILYYKDKEGQATRCNFDAVCDNNGCDVSINAHDSIWNFLHI